MGAYESPEAAYWAFFETFNAKSASGRAAVMSYPHLRVAATRSEPSIQQTAEEFEAAASWEQVERAGWAWTQPITPRVVHRSSDKVHFAGGWTRFRSDGSEISQNRLLYIATKMEQGWGIQGAFGVEGYLTGEEAQPAARAALAALKREMAMLEAGNFDTWLDCFHYPVVIVFAPGMLELYETRESLDEAYRPWASEPRPVLIRSAGDGRRPIRSAHRADGHQRRRLVPTGIAVRRARRYLGQRGRLSSAPGHVTGAPGMGRYETPEAKTPCASPSSSPNGKSSPSRL